MRIEPESQQNDQKIRRKFTKLSYGVQFAYSSNQPSRNMAETIILLLIQKLEKYVKVDTSDDDESYDDESCGNELGEAGPDEGESYDDEPCDNELGEGGPDEDEPLEGESYDDEPCENELGEGRHEGESYDDEPCENELGEGGPDEDESYDDEPCENELGEGGGPDEDEPVEDKPNDEGKSYSSIYDSSSSDDESDELHPYDFDTLGMVIKEMKRIRDIVREKKFGEGRRLNFLVSDLVHMVHEAIGLYKQDKTYKMECIQSWIEVIKMRMLKLGDDGAETESNSENVDEYVVIGLDKDMEMVIRSMICQTKGNRSLVLIKGMAGIGKTTLAREIYNHALVIERFKYRAWVCVSNVLTLKEIIIKLLQHVVVDADGENLHTLEEMDNRSLLYMLHQHMQGLPYLIVLDDLPRQIHFRPIWKALRKQESDGSKLVVTSHMTHQFMKSELHDVHRMEPLDSIMSWKLFYKTINSGNKLRSEQKFPMEMERQSKLMLRECGGLPLAIKEVANQLAEKKVSSGSEWEQLLESVDFGPTLELLEPFYQKLNPRLLLFFMYMAFFKENSTLREEKLMQIWTVGGGNNHRDILIGGLIDESVIDEVNDKSTRYRMNPVLHRLSIKKLEEEEMGFEIIDRNNRPILGNPRVRVIICSRDYFCYSTNQDKYLVCLIFHGGGYFDASPSYWKGFESLITLDLDDFGLKILPETIGTLTKLGYLGLRNNYIKKLPKSLRSLENLEVLDIAQNFMVEVPDIIWEMGSLLHLYMSDVIFWKPFKIDVLQHLHTLTSVSVDDLIYELSGLKMLTWLQKLGIRELDGNAHVSKLFVLLSHLKALDHLILRGYRYRSMPCLDELGTLQHVNTLKLDGRLVRLPNSFPSQMSSLTLANSCLDEDPMPLLGKLSKLEYLKLRNAYTGRQMGIFKDDFPFLQVLCIEELWNLRNLQIEENALNRLESIEIRNCPYLDTLPEEVRSIDDLDYLKMVTTKTISTNMRNSHSISKIRFVNINP